MQIFGEDCGRKLRWILEDNIGNKFYPKQIFLEGNFVEQVLEEQVLLEANFLGGNFGAKLLGKILQVKFHFGKKIILEGKNVLVTKYGEQKLLGANVSSQNFLGGKIWQAKFESKIFL